ncbi:uncharacterized protein LOC119385479 [Rhipicephalus sanguineus]|uniref:uncharacterized protein LOC119385479 n=1 Tax=Rhipicephalus sanguineus TaxID=34632 RepID=UPI00189488BF|nr:uncharacterized protein LOC119385479 [Rhipicephalus sanguineus]
MFAISWYALCRSGASGGSVASASATCWPAQSEPPAVAPAPKAAVVQSNPPTSEQSPATPGSSGLKASPRQARPETRTNSSHVPSQEAMDTTSVPLVPKDRRRSLDHAKKTKKQITGPVDGPAS